MYMWYIGKQITKLFYCMYAVSLLAEDDAIARSLRSLGVDKVQTIKEVQEIQPNPIQVVAAKHLGVAYQNMGKMGFN